MNSIQDTGLTCPKCEYNLTGLEEPHCPECGGQFTWQQVREHARQPQPTIAFEKARGWRKIPAFFQTWLTMLVTPWIFARQACQSICTEHVLLFGGLWISFICVLLTHDRNFLLSHQSSMGLFEIFIIFDMTIILSGIYGLIQSIVLSFWDPTFHRS